MKQIIKKGTKTTYYKTCPNCGCEFSYKISDTENGIITCPDCGAELIHQTLTPIPNDILKQCTSQSVPKQLNTSYNPCLECPYYKALQNKTPFLGDSPYNLCQGGTNTVC